MCEEEMKLIKYDLNQRLKDGWSNHIIQLRKNCDDSLLTIYITAIKFKLELSGKPLNIYRVQLKDFLLGIYLDKECESKKEILSTVQEFIAKYERYGGLRLA